MSEKLHEMLAYVLENDGGISKGKARSLASYFGSLQDFFSVKKEELENLKGVKGKRTIRLSEEEIKRVIGARIYLSPEASLKENLVEAMCRQFTNRQLTMMRSLTLSGMIPNPLLIRALNLKTPQEVVKLNVYMFVTRSIVTSFGFFVEKLLLSSSDSSERASEGWDLLKTNGEDKHWIQVKSGPNDMDKDQIVYWAEKIQEKIDGGDKAYIGITYGKSTLSTVTLGLIKQLLPDWKMKTLIGRELWDFISDDSEYHEKIFMTLRKAAKQVLKTQSIGEEIEKKVEEVEKEFIDKYGDGEEGISKYIEAIV